MKRLVKQIMKRQVKRIVNAEWARADEMVSETACETASERKSGMGSALADMDHL